jgi:uncharacterized membrane-anchored protein
MIDDSTNRVSTPSLFAEALSQMTTLFETEIRLLKSEIGEKITQAVTSIGVLVVSAVLLVAALILLLEGVVQLLIAYGWSAYGSNFLVGVIIAVIGGIAVFMAMKGLSASNLAPSRSMTQLSKDAQIVKEQAR